MNSKLGTNTYIYLDFEKQLKKLNWQMLNKWQNPEN